MLNALHRHDRGEQIVVPIVLRSVDFKGLPIERLKMLPKDAKAVISRHWFDQDEAFLNIAEGLRRVVEHFSDNRSLQQHAEAQLGVESEERMLDAAISATIPVNTTCEVVAQVRLRESSGLSALIEDPSRLFHEIKTRDVRSEPFRASYSNQKGHRSSPDYRLTVDAPDLNILDEDKIFVLESSQDSIVFRFFIKALQTGEHLLRVNLYAGKMSLTELGLETDVRQAPRPGNSPGMYFLVASVKLRVNAIARAMSSTSAR